MPATEQFDLYGTQDTDVDDLARRIASATGLEWEARDSSYLGEYASIKDAGGAEIVVQRNLPDDEGDLSEDGFPGTPTPVYVSRSTPELAQALADLPYLTLLRSERT